MSPYVNAIVSAWDAVSTVETVHDPCESMSNKVLSVELFALGMVTPGGGGSTALRYSDDAAAWLGKGAKVMKNDVGDTVFLSKDGLRRLRFDINRPYPHQNPHGHVEELIHGKWKKSGPIYPKDVPHE